MAICNICRAGEAEFVGHEYSDKSAKIFSVYKCFNPWCQAIHKVEQPPVGPNAFDIDDPRAVKGMLATDDYLKRIFKGKF